MPKFRGKVITITVSYLTVEAVDMYEADAIAQNMSVEEVNRLAVVSYDEIEVFPNEFPEEVNE